MIEFELNTQEGNEAIGFVSIQVMSAHGMPIGPNLLPLLQLCVITHPDAGPPVPGAYMPMMPLLQEVANGLDTKTH